MIARYSVTLALVVLLVTAALSMLSFATNSRVLSGKTYSEAFRFALTVDTDDSHVAEISPKLKQVLEDGIRFQGEGAARVISAKVEITPEKVSWTVNKRNFTAPGAALSAQVQWDTLADSANASDSSIYLVLPNTPELAGGIAILRSGPYEDRRGSHLVREVKSYQSESQADVARFVFALPIGLAFGVLLHSICWAIVLYREKRSRIAALPPQGTGLPQTFFPKAFAEWNTWLYALGFGAFVASLLPLFSIADGTMNSDTGLTAYFVLAISLPIAMVAAFFTHRGLVTVRVAAEGIAYARGRADLEWLNAAWSDVYGISEKARRTRSGTKYWIEIDFSDKRKTLKIRQTIEGYAALRDLLNRTYAPARAG